MAQARSQCRLYATHTTDRADTQNDATQSTTGVIKFEKNGKVTKQNINGTEKIINGPKIKPIDDKIRGL